MCPLRMNWKSSSLIYRLFALNLYMDYRYFDMFESTQKISDISDGTTFWILRHELGGNPRRAKAMPAATWLQTGAADD